MALGHLRSACGANWPGRHAPGGDRPAWYVWTSDAPGAYGLELLHAEGEGGLVRGLLGIKYYPSPSEDLRAAFSQEERDTVAGVRFDPSGTPAFEARDEIPAHLFQVGALEIVGDLERNWCGFSLAALSACRKVGPDGGLLRRPPGWRLSHVLFAKLLGLHAYASKHTPVLAAFSQEPGLELAPAPGGCDEARPCALNQAYGLGVLFGPEPGNLPLSREAWLELLPEVSPGAIAGKRPLPAATTTPGRRRWTAVRRSIPSGGAWPKWATPPSWPRPAAAPTADPRHPRSSSTKVRPRRARRRRALGVTVRPGSNTHLTKSHPLYRVEA